MNVNSTTPQALKASGMLAYTFQVFFLLLIALHLVGCGKSPESARKELANLNKQYTPVEFVTSALDGDKMAVELFLDAGMDVNTTDEKNSTALMLAAAKGHFEIVKLLLEKGAKIDLANSDGITALMVAVIQGNDEITKTLIGKGAAVDLTDKNGRTSLIIACAKGNEEIVKLLVERGANVDATTSADGVTTLMVAVIKGNDEITKILLGKGAAINLTDKGGRTALSYAIIASSKGTAETVRFLLEKGADPNAKFEDKSGVTELIAATRFGNLDVVKLLVKAGARVNTETTEGSSALDDAVTNERKDIKDFLVQSGASFASSFTMEMKTKLLKAQVQQSLFQARQPSDVEPEDAFKTTRKIITAELEQDRKLGCSEVDIADLLTVSELAVLNEANLPWDIGQAKREAINKLIKEIDASRVAASKKFIQDYLERHADTLTPIESEDAGRLLTRETTQDNAEIVKMLIKKGADVNVVNREGKTPLMIAQFLKDNALIKLLQEAGAK